MKVISKTERASVLVTSLLTITVLTLIAGTSLYIASQNGNSGMQTASWQQALSAAESAINWGIVTLNRGPTNSSSWSGWKTVNTTMPATKPSGGTNAAGPPVAGSYNYLIPDDVTSQGEGNNTLSMWVMMDTGGGATPLPVDPTSNAQWYRIRATGVATVSGPPRLSNQKLDNDLRNSISLLVNNRRSGQPRQVTRTIEVVMQPLKVSSGWARAVEMKNSINMSGGGLIDSFNSGDSSKSTNHLYDPTKRQSNGDVATLNSTNSDLKSTYVYGDLSYSGPAVKNTNHVEGTISTPFTDTIANTYNPNNSNNPSYVLSNYARYNLPAGPVTYTSYSGGSPPVASVTANGTAANPTLIKVNGDFTVPGGQTFTINPGSGSGTGYITIWITGKLTTSGSGLIQQMAGTHVTWYSDSDITVSGGSYNNQGGYATDNSIIAVGSGKVTVSGSGNFIGTLDAPGYDVTISGTGYFVGAVIGDTLNISGGAGLHFDEALLGGLANPTLGNYSFASWFEDNADVPRGITY
jgi:hypothetical protein